MIALLQRVSQANVVVDGREIAAIDRGLLVLVGVQKGDGLAQAQRLMERVIAYRVFEDSQGRMNHSLKDVGGGLLLVPQFTLAADTNRGLRPSFSAAAEPQDGRRLFEQAVSIGRQLLPNVAVGEFGADMKVGLVNDGPVTFWLQVN